MMREIEKFYSTQIEEMPMYVHLHQYADQSLTLFSGTLPISSKSIPVYPLQHSRFCLLAARLKIECLCWFRL